MALSSTPPAISTGACNLRALLVVDHSEASQRAVRYAAGILSCCRGLNLSLAYVLPALPAELLEFGGSEDPQKEDELQTSLHQDQEQWFVGEREKARQFVEETKRTLANGIAAVELETRYIEPETGNEIADELLELAKQQRCSTIIVGHKSPSWFQELAGRRDLVEQLLRQAEGFAIWVVE